MIQNAAGEIAHDVVTQHAARLRGAGNDQIEIIFARFREDLIDHDSVTDVNLRRHTHFFQALFLGA